MEEEKSCWCACEGGAEAEAEAGAQAEAEAGLRCHSKHLVQLRRETHRRRMAQFVAAALLLLLGGILAVFLTFRLEKPCHSTAESPTPAEPDSQSSGLAEKLVQRKDATAPPPSAMLTAPMGNNVRGGYLLWEDKIGNAHVQGGFTYSNGSLTVPKEGLYRVFLQTSYEIHDKECENVVNISDKVLLFDHRYPQNQNLLSAVDTVVCSRGVWKKSLFTSGLFKLVANVKLHATSNHPHLMLKNEHQVFFGAELVFD